MAKRRRRPHGRRKRKASSVQHHPRTQKGALVGQTGRLDPPPREQHPVVVQKIGPVVITGLKVAGTIAYAAFWFYQWMQEINAIGWHGLYNTIVDFLKVSQTLY